MVRATWNGVENMDAAFHYARPYAEARQIDGHVAFRRVVKVADDTSRRSARSWLVR